MDVLEAQARAGIDRVFDVDGVLARGPFSVVYRGRPRGDHGPAAPLVIKAVPCNAAPLTADFSRLATQAASLHHAHIVRVFESGAAPGCLWYASELAVASPLDVVLAERNVLSRPETQLLIEQLAAALDYGHRRNVVHGNLKPENVLVADGRWGLLTDFGMPPSALLAAPESFPIQPHLAPEVRAGQALRPAADQYALAVLVYRCLSGKAIAEDTDAEMMLDAAEQLAREHPDLPQPEAIALARALSPRPADRFPSVLAFAAALDGRTASNPWSASFAPSPRRKKAPQVLLIEPEEAQRGRRWRKVTTGVMALAGVALAITAFPGREADPISGGAPFSQTAQTDSVSRVPPGRPEPPRPAPTASKTPTPADRGPAPVAARAAPAPPSSATTGAAPAPRPEAGRLSVSSIPWGQLYVGSLASGNTPLADLPIAPGKHRIRIVREGYEPYDRMINVAPGQRVRLTGVVLRRIT